MLFCSGFPRLMLAVARLAQKYALRVHSDPLAGRALQMADTAHERPKVSLRSLILSGNNSATQ